jgi:hypothetical protein
MHVEAELAQQLYKLVASVCGQFVLLDRKNLSRQQGGFPACELNPQRFHRRDIGGNADGPFSRETPRAVELVAGRAAEAGSFARTTSHFMDPMPARNAH